MSFVETWNGLAEAWLAHVRVAAWVGLGVYAAIAVVWRLARRRASTHLGFALHLLPLAALVLPTASAVVVRVPVAEPIARHWPVELAPPSEGAGPSTGTGAGAQVAAVRMSSAAAPAATRGALHELPPRPGARPTLAAWIFTLWLGVVAFLLTRFAFIQLRTQRVVRSARRLAPEAARRVRRLLAAHGAHRVRVVESEAVTSPAAWGVRRWTILLPPRFGAQLDDEALRWMLLHELAHLRRFDPLLEAAQRVVQVLWFFHPLVWRLHRDLDELRECACDEAALARLDRPRRRDLVEALLEVAAGSSAAAAPPLALQSLQKESLLMKKRILRLMNDDANPRRGLALGAVPLLLGLGALPLVSLQLEGTRAARVSAEPAATTRAPLPREAEAREALEGGLDYLLAYQHEDGSWTAGPGLDEDVGEFNKHGITGFVVLSMLHARDHARDAERRARFDAAARRGLAYLGGELDAETDLFGGYRGFRAMASHAVATRAWIVGHAGDDPATWRPVAERALAAIERAKNPYVAWRFSNTPDGDNDAFTTSLMLLALAAARDAGFEVHHELSDSPLRFLEEMYDPDSGRTGYNRQGGLPPRLAGRTEDFPAKYSEMVTGVAICARLAWGQSPVRVAAIRRGAPCVADAAPSWNRERGTIDYYSWAFGSQALAQLGGHQWEYWREQLVEALLEGRRLDPEDRTWWPAVDAWSTKRATLHSTVLGVMSLQAALEA